MQPRALSEELGLVVALRQVRWDAYTAVCPPMNRAQRRTAKGRLLVALAETAALRAENLFLREAGVLEVRG